MENNYVMGEAKAKELETVLIDDIMKGYYRYFAKVEAVLSDVLIAIEKKLPFTYEQDCTLRANGYIQGKVADWYYPRWNYNWEIIRDKK